MKNKFQLEFATKEFQKGHTIYSGNRKFEIIGVRKQYWKRFLNWIGWKKYQINHLVDVKEIPSK